MIGPVECPIAVLDQAFESAPLVALVAAVRPVAMLLPADLRLAGLPPGEIAIVDPRHYPDLMWSRRAPAAPVPVAGYRI